MKLDLFRFDVLNRGSIMLIRTGPWEFSRRFVVSLRRNGLVHERGYVRRNGRVTGCPDEQTAFELAGMKYLEPEKR